MRGLVLLLAILPVALALAGEPPAEPILRVEAGMHTAIVNKAVVTHDGRLLTVSDDKTARLWSVGSGLSGILRVPIDVAGEGRLYTVAASPVKGIAVVGGDTGFAWDGAGSVYGFDLATGKMTGRIGNLPGTVQVLAYSKDGRFLAIGTARKGGGHLRILDLVEKTLAAEDNSYGNTVVAAEFLADGHLATASLDGKIRLYAGPKFDLAASYTLPNKEHPWRLAVSPQGDRIAVGSLDTATVTLLATTGLKPVGRLSGEHGRPGTLSAVVWLDNTLLAAGTYSDGHDTKLIRAWNLADKNSAREAALAVDTVTDLVALPDHTVAFTTAEPSVGIIDPKTLKTAAAWRRPIADFRDAFKGTFALAEDGSAIDFGMVQEGRSPFRFDLFDHALVKDPQPRGDMKRPAIPADVRDWRNSLKPSVKGTPVALDQDEYARSVAATADGSGILLGADYSLRLFRKGKTVWKLDLQAPAWAVNLSHDGRFALAALGDGTLRWYQTSDGQEVLAFFSMADGRWIAWTPEGYFDHAPGAENLVGYHLNHGRATDPEFVLSGQIHRNFYRPDLVIRKIRGEDLSQQVAKTGEAKTVVTKRIPPSLSLLAWCVHGQCNEATTRQATRQNNQIITVDAAEVTLRVGIQDRGGGTGKVVVKRNAATVTTRATTLPSQETTRVEEHPVVLEPGDNLVTITAYDSEQTVAASAPIQLVIRYAAAQPSAPNLYVLSIGINRYHNAQIPELVNAVSDAKGMAELLAQVRQGLFKEARLTVLTEQQATLGNIQQAFKQIATAVKPEDVVVVFLAGHGIVDNEEGQYYFLPYDTGELTLASVKATALTQAAFTKLISSLPNSRIAVLIDTCHAGAFAIPDTVLRQSHDRTWINALGFDTGRFILTGTTTQQEALDGVNGHGVFTAVVLDGLKGKADMAAQGNHDGRVDVVELTRYTKEQVPKEVSKIAPTHAQQVAGFFAGNDFFDLSVDITPGGSDSAASPQGNQ